MNESSQNQFSESIAFIFPGQGSQRPGMLADYYQHEPIFRETIEQASDQLQLAIWPLISEGSAEQLAETVITQTVMLACDVGIWRVWQAHLGAMPRVMAGHSLGEYAALVCSGVISFEQALLTVKARAELMQAAVPAGSGGMAAILGLSIDALTEVCEQVVTAEEGSVSLVNLNAPGQIVIGGHRVAVERAVALAKAAGAKKAIMLPMSVPSHCDLMRPAADQLQASLAQLSMSQPQCSVVNNVDVAECIEPVEIQKALYRQLFSPVRWIETIQYIQQLGVTKLYECGPGKVLSGLNKRIDKTITSCPLESRDQLLAYVGEV